jgi:Domain of unknown function, B. Theta Gene description (DUF3873)
MKSDIQGCSTCPVGQEQYEEFISNLGRKKTKKVQYDYRHTNGKLFSCIANNLEEARSKKDEWLKTQQ